MLKNIVNLIKNKYELYNLHVNYDVNAFINPLDLDEELIKQIKGVSTHPARVGHVVILPDSHLGYGMPIGCVLATKDAVVPNAVGVDIGCSMSLVRTSLKRDDVSLEELNRIVDEIYRTVPVGQNHNKEKQNSKVFNKELYPAWDNTVICKQEYESAQYQIGTLGGGNHFIEIQVGEDGYIYIMIHSGSRNLGYKVCKYYNKIAEDLCNRYYHKDVVKNQLAFIPKGLDEYDAYTAEMNLCKEFAKENHLSMQTRVAYAIVKVLNRDITFSEPILTTHNYATYEHIDGQNLMIHRKGAISAREGVKAIIPGSQGTSSYLVEGLGNPASLYSASHGSGRKMSRAKAKSNLNLSVEQARMGDIVHRIKSIEDLEEAPSAYKDIEDVIKRESMLVKPVMKLRPIAVVKG